MDFIFGPFEASLFIWAHHIREAEHLRTLSKLRKYFFQTPQVFLHSQEKKNGKTVFFPFSCNLCSYTDGNPIARKQMCSLATKIVDIFERTAGNDFKLDIQYLISNIKYLILIFIKLRQIPSVAHDIVSSLHQLAPHFLSQNLMVSNQL